MGELSFSYAQDSAFFDDRFGEPKHAQPGSSGYFKNLDLLGNAAK
jgi:hypothetical protein